MELAHQPRITTAPDALVGGLTLLISLFIVAIVLKQTDELRSLASLGAEPTTDVSAIASAPGPEPLSQRGAKDEAANDRERLLKEATRAVRRRRYAKGLRLCEELIAADPDNQRGRLVCGIAACNLKRADRAREHIARVRGATRRASLRQLCIRLMPYFE